MVMKWAIDGPGYTVCVYILLEDLDECQGTLWGLSGWAVCVPDGG